MRVASSGLVVLMVLAGCGREGSIVTRFEPDSVASAYATPSAALMAPGTTRAFHVDSAGHLYNGAWRVRVLPQAEAALAGPPRVIAALDRSIPVLRWVRRGGGLRWDFEAVPFTAEPPADSVLVVSLMVRASNESATPQSARLVFEAESPATTPPFVAWDLDRSAPLRWNGAGDQDPVIGIGSSGRADASRLSWSWQLGAGRSRSARALLSAYPLERRVLRRLAARSHATRVQEAERAWRSLLDQGAVFSVGDPEVERALDAARIVLLSCRERRGDRWIPIGGPFQYRDVWIRDGARAAQALAMAGHGAVARDLIRGIADLQWPNGAFMSQRGQPDGTGQALWAFEQVLLTTLPDSLSGSASDSLAVFVEATRRGWRWLEWQRDLGRQSGWPAARMLPYADPRDAELTRAQLIGTDAWALAGYRAASRLLRAVGESVEADSIDASWRRYAMDFTQRLAGLDREDVPPSWQGLGRDWGNLAVSWPCEALPPADPRLRATARRAWGLAGSTGLVTYGTPDTLHYYLGADLGTWALLAGERAAADSVLAALLHWRDATGAAGEMFTRRGEFGSNLPPHPTSAAALVTLVRNSLIVDDGHVLYLTLGARDRWWRKGSVRRAPTRWGPLDLEFGVRGGEAWWRWTPVPTWTVLELPPGTSLARPPEPPLRPRVGDRAVQAPPGTREARVALRESSP